MIDEELVNEAKAELKRRYKKGIHHTAVAMRAGGKIYTAAHLDTKGFDVCAEPIVISKALDDAVTDFDRIVCVTLDEEGSPGIINPCGNCRQILVEITPGITVIVNNRGTYSVVPATDLLPIPYT